MVPHSLSRDSKTGHLGTDLIGKPLQDDNPQWKLELAALKSDPLVPPSVSV